MNTESLLVGLDGRPLVTVERNGRDAENRVKGFLTGGTPLSNSYVSALNNIRADSRVKAQDPFTNHPWVFAAAMVKATVASQAPFGVMVEKPEYTSFLDLFAKRMGRHHVARMGSQRRAMIRHSTVSLRERLRSDALMLDTEHPLALVLNKPNPLMSGVAHMQATFIWLAIRGECFWVKETEDGQSPTLSGAPVARLWCLGPDLFEPMLEDWTSVGLGKTAMGELIGWWFHPPLFMGRRREGAILPIPLDDVIQFKYPDPVNPVRGMSRITSVAQGIESDFLAKEYNRSTIANGGDPGGVLTHDDQLDKPIKAEILAKFEERHQGVAKRNRTALLDGGLKYQSISLSPKDMEFLEQQRWTREEILAVMLTPPSVLGITQFTNYATQLGQDKNFWDKSELPDMRLIEAAVDAGLFGGESDRTCALFDLKDIEALRAGIQDRITSAQALAGPVLRASPKVAYEVVGLDVPEYQGDSEILVSSGLTKIQDVLNPPEPLPSESSLGTPPGSSSPEKPDDPGATPPGEGPPVPPGKKPGQPGKTPGQNPTDKTVKEFNEEDHPRDESGKFTSGGGGGTSVSTDEGAKLTTGKWEKGEDGMVRHPSGAELLPIQLDGVDEKAPVVTDPAGSHWVPLTSGDYVNSSTGELFDKDELQSHLQKLAPKKPAVAKDPNNPDQKWVHNEKDGTFKNDKTGQEVSELVLAQYIGAGKPLPDKSEVPSKKPSVPKTPNAGVKLNWSAENSGTINMWENAQPGIAKKVDAWAKKLSKEEIHAIQYYTGHGAAEINKELWTGDISSKPALAERERQLDDAIKAAPKFTGTVYRGARMDQKVIDKLKVGGTLKMKGVTSTSLSPHKAMGFISYAGKRPAVRFEIKAKKARIVEPLSLHRGEQEALFRKGSRFKVVDVSPPIAGAYNPHYRIKLEQK